MIVKLQSQIVSRAAAGPRIKAEWTNLLRSRAFSVTMSTRHFLGCVPGHVVELPDAVFGRDKCSASGLAYSWDFLVYISSANKYDWLL